jgi:hypothetical protein
MVLGDEFGPGWRERHDSDERPGRRNPCRGLTGTGRYGCSRAAPSP